MANCRAAVIPAGDEPTNDAASLSFTTMVSIRRSAEGGRGRKGATLTTTWVSGPLRSIASTTASSGTSSWATTTALSEMRSDTASTSAACTSPLAPGAMITEFSPSGVTTTKADPVAAPATSVTRDTSTPRAARSSRCAAPVASAPTRPNRATVAPPAAAAAA